MPQFSQEAGLTHLGRKFIPTVSGGDMCPKMSTPAGCRYPSFVRLSSTYSTTHSFLGLFAMPTTGPSADTPSFESRPTLQYAATVGMQAALVGAFVSSVQNALGSHSKGAAGFLSRTGGTIGFFGAFFLQICSKYQVHSR